MVDNDQWTLINGEKTIIAGDRVEENNWDMALGSQVETNGEDGAVKIPMVNGKEQRAGELNLIFYLFL